jgi:16S rRNA processing protein RimM
MKGGEAEPVVVGTVLKAHGLRGELKVKASASSDANLRDAGRLWVGIEREGGDWYTVERVTASGSTVVVKLKGVDDRNRAEAMRGSVMKIARAHCRNLPDGSYYTFDLVGLQARTTSGLPIGTVRDVLAFPAQAVLVIDSNRGEILIPAVKRFITNIDTESRTITIDPIDGLLDGNDH